MEAFWIAITVSLLAANSQAIECYQCIYTTVTGGDDCLGPYPAFKNLLPCPAGYDYCSKINSELNIFGMKGESVIRNCSEVYISEQCGVIGGLNGCLNFCSSDGCNKGNSLMMTTTILSFAVALYAAILLIKW
ncbi:uncharacterized protein LOC143462760 [Clavelina lepadiformis]|uniref:uncharacterized protein LOC143462760 n=1 Tax=Clavelina lepadiformis TaxID=159417 RepID=UPI004041E3AA